MAIGDVLKYNVAVNVLCNELENIIGTYEEEGNYDGLREDMQSLDEKLKHIEKYKKGFEEFFNTEPLYKYQSIRWDMNISLEDLLCANEVCRVNREYKAHKYDDCYHGYCMYLKHPSSDKYSVMIGIWEDGFTYLGDGEDDSLPFGKTVDVVSEMFFYGEWVKAKEKSLNRLNDKIETEYIRLKEKLMND